MRHTTHRNNVAEVRIVDQRTVIKYRFGGVVSPLEEYDTAQEANKAAFSWLREQYVKWCVETTGPDAEKTTDTATPPTTAPNN